ncbi:hypothetical protein BDZ91DRAFT_702894 [Kalaharituber pfeilii]|nr:hypothetical protein BDZ91DRAFT_702894 [Kalaharituber pfeilii]
MPPRLPSSACLLLSGASSPANSAATALRGFSATSPSRQQQQQPPRPESYGNGNGNGNGSRRPTQTPGSSIKATLARFAGNGAPSSPPPSPPSFNSTSPPSSYQPNPHSPSLRPSELPSFLPPNYNAAATPPQSTSLPPSFAPNSWASIINSQPLPSAAAADTSPLTDADSEELYRLQKRFRQGEIYAPKDLSFETFKNWRKRKAPSKDVFDELGLNPLEEYKNFNLLAEYVTDMGRIKHRSETGLRPVNQRRIAKAIRRAVGIGLLPSTHKHPELLKLAEDQFFGRQSYGRRGGGNGVGAGGGGVGGSGWGGVGWGGGFR